VVELDGLHTCELGCLSLTKEDGWEDVFHELRSVRVIGDRPRSGL
jgi:hypothetical protein